MKRESEDHINTMILVIMRFSEPFYILYEKNEMVKYRQKLLKTIILPESGRDVIELLVK